MASYYRSQENLIKTISNHIKNKESVVVLCVSPLDCSEISDRFSSLDSLCIDILQPKHIMESYMNTLVTVVGSTAVIKRFIKEKYCTTKQFCYIFGKPEDVKKNYSAHKAIQEYYNLFQATPSSDIIELVDVVETNVPEIGGDVIEEANRDNAFLNVLKSFQAVITDLENIIKGVN
jgi:hypothetical protein